MFLGLKRISTLRFPRPPAYVSFIPLSIFYLFIFVHFGLNLPNHKKSVSCALHAGAAFVISITTWWYLFLHCSWVCSPCPSSCASSSRWSSAPWGNGPSLCRRGAGPASAPSAGRWPAPEGSGSHSRDSYQGLSLGGPGPSCLAGEASPPQPPPRCPPLQKAACISRLQPGSCSLCRLILSARGEAPASGGRSCRRGLQRGCCLWQTGTEAPTWPCFCRDFAAMMCHSSCPDFGPLRHY